MSEEFQESDRALNQGQALCRGPGATPQVAHPGSSRGTPAQWFMRASVRSGHFNLLVAWLSHQTISAFLLPRERQCHSFSPPQELQWDHLSHLHGQRVAILNMKMQWQRHRLKGNDILWSSMKKLYACVDGSSKEHMRGRQREIAIE